MTRSPPTREAWTHRTPNPLGSLPAFLRRPTQFLAGLEATGEPVVRFRLAHVPVFYLTTKASVREVLVSKAGQFRKGGLIFDAGRRTLGNGILFSDDDFWRRQRRAINPAFRRAAMRYYAAKMQARAQALADRLRASRESIDMHLAFNDLAMLTVRDCLFGEGLEGLRTAELIHALSVLMDDTQFRVRTGDMIPAWLPTPRNRRARRAFQLSTEIVTDIIERRQAETRPPDHGLLDMLLWTPMPGTDRPMPVEHIVDEVKVMFLAGADTSANCMTHLTWQLREHPDILTRVRAEMDGVLGGRPAGLDDLPDLTYTQRVITESLRLMPPAWVFSRSTRHDVDVMGIRIPEACTVLVCPYLLHRRSEYFREPEAFDPDRHASPGGFDEDAYIAFGAGRRQCIGQRFAMAEITIVLSVLVQHFDWSFAPGFRYEPFFGSTLHPADGMWLDVSPRA